MQIVVDSDFPSRSGQKFAAAFATIGLMDALWVGYISKKMGIYKPTLEAEAPISKQKAIGGMVLYFILAAFFFSFVKTTSYETAVSFGALLGFLVFGTFNLTTLLINGRWSTTTAAIDTTYGTVCYLVVGLVVHAIDEA